MPPSRQDRPKRHKIALACEPCRDRKARCDGRKPLCSTCQRRSLDPERCIYKVGNARNASNDDYTKQLQDRIKLLEEACERHGVSIDSNSVITGKPIHASNGTRGNAEAVTPMGPPPRLNSMSQEPSIPNIDCPSTVFITDKPLNQLNTTPSPASGDGFEVCSHASGITAMGTILNDDALAPPTDTATQHFYGRSSAASFLKEAYSSMGMRLVKQPSRNPEATATVNYINNDKSASVLSTYANFDKFPLPPRPFADHLIHTYFQKVYYLYPFFDRYAFEHAYSALWQSAHVVGVRSDEFRGLGLGSPSEGDSKTSIFHVALNAIFALACNFSDLPKTERVTAAEAFFNRAKNNIGLNFLDMSNLGVVQALLLVGQALQGGAFPNRCWDAVGAACRVAYGLGLHNEPPYSPGETREKAVRRRTWYGCVNLEMLVGMTFGRPTMTMHLSTLLPTRYYTANISSQVELEEIKLQFHTECLRLSVILERLLSTVYQSQKPNLEDPPASEANTCPGMDAISDIHKRLQSFEQTVPAYLSWVCPTKLAEVDHNDQEILEMQRNVLHARYLYLRLILHRPALTKLSATARSVNQYQMGPEVSPGQIISSRLLQAFELECAKSCMEDAMNLSSLIHSTFETSLTGAWWWNGLYACTAGLALLVSCLCLPLRDSLPFEKISGAWNNCRAILENLASLSASAQASLNLLLKIHEGVFAQQDNDTEIISEGQSHFLPGQWRGTSQDEISALQQPLLQELDTMGPFFYSWEALDLATFEMENV